MGNKNRYQSTQLDQNAVLFNRHHLFFQKDSYKGTFQRKFRNHEGLVIPVLKSSHKELHNILAPPPKPTHDMMDGCLNTLEQDLSKLMVDPFFAVHAICDYLEMYRQRVDDISLSKLAQGIIQNLSFQVQILTNNTLVEVTRNDQF
jgi:hypothetical protein